MDMVHILLALYGVFCFGVGIAAYAFTQIIRDIYQENLHQKRVIQRISGINKPFSNGRTS